MQEHSEAFKKDAVDAFKLFTASIFLCLGISFMVAVGLSICGVGPSEYRGILVCAGGLTLVSIYIPYETRSRLIVFKRFAMVCAALGVGVPLFAVYINGVVKPMAAIYPVIGLLPYIALYEGYLKPLRRLATDGEPSDAADA